MTLGKGYGVRNTHINVSGASQSGTARPLKLRKAQAGTPERGIEMPIPLVPVGNLLTMQPETPCRYLPRSPGPDSLPHHLDSRWKCFPSRTTCAQERSSFGAYQNRSELVRQTRPTEAIPSSVERKIREASLNVLRKRSSRTGCGWPSVLAF